MATAKKKRLSKIPADREKKLKDKRTGDVYKFILAKRES